MRTTIQDHNKGFSKTTAEMRNASISYELKCYGKKHSEEYKKIADQDSYGVQKKRIITDEES